MDASSSNSWPANTSNPFGLNLIGELPRRPHPAILSFDVLQEDDLSGEIKIQLMAENVAEVNQLDLEEWLVQRVEELPRSLRDKKLDLTIEMLPDNWDQAYGHDMVDMLLSWAMDRIRSLQVVLPTTYGGGVIELVRARKLNARFPLLESLTWTGDIERSLFSKVPFGQLTTVKLLGCNLCLDDCIEVLYRCEKIVAFSNFEPEDAASALAISYPPLSQLSIVQPHTHTQHYRCQIRHLTSLSVSFFDISMLFDKLYFPQLEDLCIRITADTPSRLENLNIQWKQLSRIVLYANLMETSSRKIKANCVGAKFHHERLDGTVIFYGT